LVVLLAFAQIVQFVAVLQMQQEVVVVEKYHPHQKCDGGDEVFVF
jgi:hypothetical protein